MKKSAFYLAGASLIASFTASASLAAAPSEAAAPEAVSDAADGGTIIITGTRQKGRLASDSPAPIEIVSAEALATAGAPGLVQALNQSVPSLTTQSFGGDLGNLKLNARLRGLSSNHTLVLVNGKRRHGASILTLSQTGGYSGAASPDLAYIPVESIDHVEVLTDGAAAQYGTDAIAGVINIILKDKNHGGSLSANVGAYGKGDGLTKDISGNIGFGTDNAYINLTGGYRSHGYSLRSGADQRIYLPANISNTALSKLDGYPILNKIYGDSKYDLYTVSYNAGVDLGDVKFYTFGSYGHRNAYSRQQYRFPSTAPTVYPEGFTPLEAAHENDYSITGGLSGDVSDWNWDLATTWGRNDARIETLNAINTALFADTGSSPTDFYDGKFIVTQWTTNLDIRRAFEVGLASPVNLAFGGEYRRDTFELKAGDYASSYKSGAAAFPGYAASDAGAYSRHNWAAYIDVALEPVEHLQLDIAGRWEDYSDFGSAKVGKATARYDFSPAFALRGTVSTGFRAPTLLEQYYSATVISPTTAGVRLPPNKAAAELLGIDPLKPEKSTNYSLGLVFKPAPRLSITLDAYQIDIRDRIVNTGAIYGIRNNALVSQPVIDAITANGNTLNTETLTSTYITTAVNGISTRTRGIELVANYSSDFGSWGSVDWSIGANYNKNKITKENDVSDIIEASSQVYLDKNAKSYLTTGSPRFKATLGAVWTIDKWTFNLHETIWGKSTVQVDGGSTLDFQPNTIHTKGITDLEVSYRPAQWATLSVGANNLFDIYPEKINPKTFAAQVASGSAAAVTTNSFGPFGFNGGYYYAKARFTF